jgi:hypothetical protein
MGFGWSEPRPTKSAYGATGRLDFAMTLVTFHIFPLRLLEIPAIVAQSAALSFRTDEAFQKDKLDEPDSYG